MPSAQPLALLKLFSPAISMTSLTVRVSVLLPLPVRSIRSIDSMRDALSGPAASWFGTLPRAKVMPLPDNRIVSMPVPPSMRESCDVLPPLPWFVISAAILLAFSRNTSLPAPPYSTSAPPLPMIVSFPAPATIVSLALVPVSVSAPLVPSWSTSVWLKAPLVEPNMT